MSVQLPSIIPCLPVVTKVSVYLPDLREAWKVTRWHRQRMPGLRYAHWEIESFGVKRHRYVRCLP